jgi:hypothetical protein
MRACHELLVIAFVKVLREKQSMILAAKALWHIMQVYLMVFYLSRSHRAEYTCETKIGLANWLQG